MIELVCPGNQSLLFKFGCVALFIGLFIEVLFHIVLEL